jgi:hypothetical protein
MRSGVTVKGQRRRPVAMPTAPRSIAPYVLRFCRDVAGEGASPRFVDVRLAEGAVRGDCVGNVAKQVARHGGEALVGWAVWEWPHVFIEAELHVIWRAPDGAELDVSPPGAALARTLFLPDAARSFDGGMVDNRRKPLCRDPDVKRFLQLAARMTRYRFEAEANDGRLKGERAQAFLGEKAQYERVGKLLQSRYGVYARGWHD